MRLIDLTETTGGPKWWEMAETVTLYHGTSSALLPDIRTNGLVPPGGDTTGFRQLYLALLDRYIETIEAEHGPVDTDALMELVASVDDGTIGYRTRHRHNGHANDAAVYLSPDFDRAAGYARSYAEHGGEVAYEIWSKVRDFTGVRPSRRFAGGQPVVLEVAVPWDWMKTKHPTGLRNYIAHLKALWHRDPKYHAAYPSEAAFLDEDLGDFEVRITETIPPSMIRQVHPVAPRQGA